jgi:hypothetical protein
MSGIYLIVWEDRCVLESTVGGHPHVTVAYTGSKLDRAALVGFAQHALEKTAMSTLRLTRAWINSFVKESTGAERHDVLLALEEDDLIDELRGAFVEGFPDVGAAMRLPHVTARACATRQEAEAYMSHILDELPMTVTVTGVTID